MRICKDNNMKKDVLQKEGAEYEKDTAGSHSSLMPWYVLFMAMLPDILKGDNVVEVSFFCFSALFQAMLFLPS